VLVRKPLVVSADFLDNAVCAHAHRAFRVVIAQAPTQVSYDKAKGSGVDGPLVEAVVAHEMDTGQIEVPTALRALRGMEQPWMVRIG